MILPASGMPALNARCRHSLCAAAAPRLEFLHDFRGAIRRTIIHTMISRSAAGKSAQRAHDRLLDEALVVICVDQYVTNFLPFTAPEKS